MKVITCTTCVFSEETENGSDKLLETEYLLTARCDTDKNVFVDTGSTCPRHSFTSQSESESELKYITYIHLLHEK